MISIETTEITISKTKQLRTLREAYWRNKLALYAADNDVLKLEEDLKKAIHDSKRACELHEWAEQVYQYELQRSSQSAAIQRPTPTPSEVINRTATTHSPSYGAGSLDRLPQELRETYRQSRSTGSQEDSTRGHHDTRGQHGEASRSLMAESEQVGAQRQSVAPQGVGSRSDPVVLLD